MTFLAHVVEFLLAAAVVAALAFGVAFVLVRAFVRRHWRVARHHPVVRGVLAGLAVLAAGRERYSARLSPTELSRGSSARVRRRLWLAVEDAEQAVAHADAHDAPVADLPAVCRSLRSVAGELDGLLRLERRLPSVSRGSDAVRVQVADVISAARDVQAAALRAGSDAASPGVRSLVRQAADEVEIVSTALARLRSLAPPH